MNVVTRACLLFGLSFCFLGNSTAYSAKPKLIAPWYLLQAQMRAALGADPCVEVEQLTGDGLNMEIKVTVCNDSKAEALAAFIAKRYEFGEQLAVMVNVYAPELVLKETSLPDSMEEIAKLLRAALTGNNYFIKVGIGGRNPMNQPAVYAAFKPMVIQYFSDDISDWYQNTNEVASKLFSDLFNLHPYVDGAVNVYATTAPIV